MKYFARVMKNNGSGSVLLIVPSVQCGTKERRADLRKGREVLVVTFNKEGD